MSTVIIGAGIIGTSTAYFLSESTIKSERIHLVEASPDLFASASGYAGGFLARDWFSSPLTKLGALSFDLHKELAEKNDGYNRWGYSQSTSMSLAETTGNHEGADWLREGASRAVAAENTSPIRGHAPSWLKYKGNLDIMSHGSTTAQVEPRRLCDYLLSTCLSRGVHLHQPAHPISVVHGDAGELQAIGLENTLTKETKTLCCTRLVIAAGAWTPQVHRTLFPVSKSKISITSLAGHSLVLHSSHWPPSPLDPKFPAKHMHNARNGAAMKHDCHAIFTTDAASEYSPELFSRMPDGHIYLAGLNSLSYPLPAIANERVIDQDSINALKKTAKRLLGKDVEVVRESVCWRPVAKRGVPIITKLIGKQDSGVIVAAGHGAWGISNSLGTGWCVAEMVEGRDMDIVIRTRMSEARHTSISSRRRTVALDVYINETFQDGARKFCKLFLKESEHGQDVEEIEENVAGTAKEMNVMAKEDGIRIYLSDEFEEAEAALRRTL